MRITFVVPLLLPAVTLAVRYHDWLSVAPRALNKEWMHTRPYQRNAQRNRDYWEDEHQGITLLEVDTNSGDANTGADDTDTGTDNVSSEEEDALTSSDPVPSVAHGDEDHSFSGEASGSSGEYRRSDHEIEANDEIRTTPSPSKLPTDGSYFKTHENSPGASGVLQKFSEASVEQVALPEDALKWTREFLKEGRSKIESVMHSNVAKAVEQRAPARKSARSLLYGLTNAFRTLEEQVLHEGQRGTEAASPTAPRTTGSDS